MKIKSKNKDRIEINISLTPEEVKRLNSCRSDFEFGKLTITHGEIWRYKDLTEDLNTWVELVDKVFKRLSKYRSE